MSSAELPFVQVVSLGGTIAMVGDGDRGVVPRLAAADLLATLPDLAGRVELRAESFRQRPSASLDLADLLALTARIEEAVSCGAAGVVITQGTDTLEETAYVLDLLYDGAAPVVLTGAMRSAAAPGADGPANLHAAVLTAADPVMRDAGAVVLMDDQIHSAARVRKVRTSAPGAFASADTGPLGWVVEGRVRLLARRNDRLLAPPFDPQQLRDSPVALVPVGLGEDPRLLEALPGLGYAGAVIDAMGAGHLPQWLVEPAARLAAHVPVVLASRAGAGRVHRSTYGYPGSETDLLARGLIASGQLDGRRARLLLTVLLAGGASRAELADWFERS